MAATMFQNAFGRNKNPKTDRSESFSRTQPPDAFGGRTNGTGPAVQSRTGRSNAGDSMAVHLLMENALEDSGSFEVLSAEDVEGARRELDALGSRLEGARRKLALEVKARDASRAVNRLDRAADAGEAAQRCDELRDEIAGLERQEQGLQRQLLEHTAGVLQMTHKGYLRDGQEPHGMRGDVDVLDNSHFYEPSMLLDALEGTGFGGGAGQGKPSAEQQQLIGDVQRKVQELNDKIRSTLLEMEPGAQDMPRQAPQPASNDVGEGLLDEVDYLDECLYKMRSAQKAQQAAKNQATKNQGQETTRNLGNLNGILYKTVTRNGQDNEFKLVPPPPAEDSTTQAQVEYLARINECVQLQIDKVDKYDSVVLGLWDVLASPDQDGEYSVQKFSAKVQEMNVRFSSLQDQKNVLTRQIQQQRELNDSGDAQKSKQLNDLQDQLNNSQAELEKSRLETNANVAKLTASIDELEAVKRELNNAGQANNQAASQELQAEQQARKRAEDQLQKASEELEDTRNMMQTSSMAMKADLDSKAKAAANSEHELHELEGRVAQLQTELTFAKAELDGAGGTRAERAVQAAAPVLQERVQTLETELRDTITDYEAMTKATIEHEKEREQLESLIDGLRDRVESLEAQLNEERIGGMGVKSPGAPAGGTSAGVLRNEFKKMMKDARESHQKSLKAEQEERRKLEAQVRQLKKDALGKR